MFRIFLLDKMSSNFVGGLTMTSLTFCKNVIILYVP